MTHLHISYLHMHLSAIVSATRTPTPPPSFAVWLGTRPNTEIGCHSCWARNSSISHPIMISYHAPYQAPGCDGLHPLGAQLLFSSFMLRLCLVSWQDGASVPEEAFPSSHALSLSNPTLCSPTAGSLGDYIIRPQPSIRPFAFI